MVKPALSYMDVICRVRQSFRVPVAAYNVSGEFSMIKAAEKLGWIDGEAEGLGEPLEAAREDHLEGAHRRTLGVQPVLEAATKADAYRGAATPKQVCRARRAHGGDRDVEGLTSYGCQGVP